MPHVRLSSRFALVALTLVIGFAWLARGPSVAHAQDGAGSPVPSAAPAPLAQPPVAPAGGTATYHSPMRPTCEEELAKDKDWFDNLKTRLLDKINRDVHGDAARYAAANNKHVIAAYAVFWVFAVAFLVLMWLRQRRLQAELGRLARELEQAIKDGGAR